MSELAERREEEKDRRRNEIIDAAEGLYAHKGWDAVRIDHVARAARLSRALVYVYFRDKEDLHFAIVERALRLLRERFAAATARHAKGIDKVEAVGRAYIAFAHEVPHYFDACSRFEAHQPEGAIGTNEKACIAAGEAVHEVIVEAIEAGQADGSIRSDLGSPLLTSTSLWGFTHGIIQIATTKAAHLAQHGVSTPEFVQHAFDLMHHALEPRR